MNRETGIVQISAEIRSQIIGFRPRLRCTPMIFLSNLRKWTLGLLLLLSSTGSVLGQPVRTHAHAVSESSRDELSETEVRLHRLFIRGLTRAELNDHVAAVELLSQALQLAPDSPAIASALAASYQALGNLTTALPYAQAAAEGDANNVYYQIALARLYRASSNPDAAIAAYRAVLALTPRNEEAWMELAQMLAATGDYRGAIDAYQHLLAIRGEVLDIHEQILNLYTIQDDTSGIRQTLETILRLAPARFEFRERLAQLYVRQEKPDKAAALFEEVLESDPTHTRAGQALADLRRTQDITDTHGAAPLAEVRSEPVIHSQANAASTPVPGQSRLAAALTSESVGTATARSNKEEAIAEAETLLQMLETDPRDLHLWARAAEAYRRMGDADRAHAILEEALLLFPDQPVLLSASALTLLDMNRLKESAALLEEALAYLAEDDVEDVELRSMLLTGQAIVYERQGNMQKSDRLYNAALDLHPQNSLALMKYAVSLATRDGHNEHALSLAQQAASVAPEDPAILHALGHIYLMQGDPQQARVWLEKAIGAGSVDARAFMHLGDAHEQLGDRERARHFWREALQLDPNNRTIIEKLD